MLTITVQDGTVPWSPITRSSSSSSLSPEDQFIVDAVPVVRLDVAVQAVPAPPEGGAGRAGPGGRVPPLVLGHGPGQLRHPLPHCPGGPAGRSLPRPRLPRPPPGRPDDPQQTGGRGQHSHIHC